MFVWRELHFSQGVSKRYVRALREVGEDQRAAAVTKREVSDFVPMPSHVFQGGVSSPLSGKCVFRGGL